MASDMAMKAAEAVVRDGFGGSIEVDQLRRSGHPVVSGTRFKIAQLIAEVCEESAVDSFCEEFDFQDPERQHVREFFRCLANMFDVPMSDALAAPDELAEAREIIRSLLPPKWILRLSDGLNKVVGEEIEPRIERALAFLNRTEH